MIPNNHLLWTELLRECSGEVSGTSKRLRKLEHITRHQKLRLNDRVCRGIEPLWVSPIEQ